MTAQARFVFRAGPSYQVHPCHGVWGGPNSHGSLEVSFYLDSPVLPDEVWMRESAELPGLLLEQARHSGSEDRTSGQVFLRRFNTAIVLSPADALAVGEWLTEHATAMLEGRVAAQARE